MSFKNACFAVNSTSQDIQLCCKYAFCMYNFQRFRCAENHTPHDHFTCVMVFYHTGTPQKTRPVGGVVHIVFFQITYHGYFRVDNSHNNLRLQEGVCQLRVL